MTTEQSNQMDAYLAECRRAKAMQFIKEHKASTKKLNAAFTAYSNSCKKLY